MHSRYQPKVIKSRNPKRAFQDPYSPSSESYAERHEEHRREVAGLSGLTRIDIGDIPKPKN